TRQPVSGGLLRRSAAEVRTDSRGGSRQDCRTDPSDMGYVEAPLSLNPLRISTFSFPRTSERRIAERFGGLGCGFAIREKIETEPKIRKWFQDLARLSMSTFNLSGQAGSC